MLQTATDTGPSHRVIAGLLKLRWYQQEAVDGFFQLLDEDPNRRPILVLPTGAGKSVVCAEIARRYHAQTGKRVIVVIHTKELVHQNYLAFRKAAPDISAGLFSASLGRKDRRCTVTFANVQSIASHAETFRGVGLVLIDECHRMPHKAEGQYHQLIEGLSKANDGEIIACGGMTATPYRMSSGNLLEPYKGEPAFFSDIAYELDILTLQEEGWLCQMVPEPTDARISIKANSKTISRMTGDYTPAALEEAANSDPLNVAIVKEVIEKCADRQSWLVFCVSIDHATRMTELFRSAGVAAACVTGATKQAERDRLIAQFKAGDLRCLVNVDVLTTGFDAPGTDALIFARPTACLDMETEILTSHGWKGADEVQVGDVVAALDMRTGEGKWSGVLAKTDPSTIATDASPEMVEYHGTFVDFRVTGNHSMIYRANGAKSWQLKPAAELARISDKADIPTAVEIDRPGVPLTDAELYFIGMVMADGSLSMQTVNITQSARYPEVQKRIEEALDACNFKRTVSVYDQDTNFGPRQHPTTVWTVPVGRPRNGASSQTYDFREPSATGRHIAEDGQRGCWALMPYLDKDFSTALMGLSKRQFEVLIRAMVDGDGRKATHHSDGSEVRTWTLCTARKVVADRIQALAVTHGYSCSVACESGPSRKGRAIYLVRIKDVSRRTIGCNSPHSRQNVEVSAAGPERVWCVETEHGTIVTRRRGKVAVVGNSPGLFTQMAGRGMRVVFADDYPIDTPEQRLAAIAEGPKPDCIVLDFAGNIAKHGTLDRIRGVFRRKHKEEKDGFKECPTCGTLSPLGTKTCPACKAEFPAGGGVSALEREQKLFTRQTAAKISTGLDELVWADVIPNSGLFRVWAKPGAPPTLRLDYKVIVEGQQQSVSEFLCFSHEPDSWACKRAKREWRYRAGTMPPSSTDEAVSRMSEMRLPLRLRLQKNARGYWDITGTRFS